MSDARVPEVDLELYLPLIDWFGDLDRSETTLGLAEAARDLVLG